MGSSPAALFRCSERSPGCSAADARCGPGGPRSGSPCSTASAACPPIGRVVCGVFLLVLRGEIWDAKTQTDLTGDVAASVTALLCPRASWQGCSFAVVCGFGRAVSRGVRLRRRRSWCHTNIWQVRLVVAGNGLAHSGRWTAATALVQQRGGMAFVA